MDLLTEISDKARYRDMHAFKIFETVKRLNYSICDSWLIAIASDQFKLRDR